MSERFANYRTCIMLVCFCSL